jgi:nucleolar GTP-binding protein
MSGVKKSEFLGRLRSILKRLEKPLDTLRAARDVLKRLPDPTSHFTVCLAGFPNAGKSTLIKTLTGAHAEIAAYAFTTRTLNYGTTEIGHLEVQFVDTPGTLNRVRTNPIEKQALLALQHLAKAIVFVYDPLREDEEQEKLFETLFVYEVPLAVYASKQDIEPKLPFFAEAKKRGVPLFTKASEITAWTGPLARAAMKHDALTETY